MRHVNQGIHLFGYLPHGQDHDRETEKKIFRYSLIIPCLFLCGFWLVFLTGILLDQEFTVWGIYPLRLKGLRGLLFSPFIHGSLKHLTANSVPFLILSFCLFYFYRSLAYRIFVLLYVLSGLGVWLAAREAWHIGASGLIYGLGSFLFFSGIFRNDVRLLTIALVVVFLYGGMFWGIFLTEASVSWESHLWGAVSGLLLGAIYRRQGPQRIPFAWESEEEEEHEADSIEANSIIDHEATNKNREHCKKKPEDS
ncbi:MAG: rhomboid family intramembrane serine protease [Mangrovibacterium sp.]